MGVQAQLSVSKGYDHVEETRIEADSCDRLFETLKMASLELIGFLK